MTAAVDASFVLTLGKRRRDVFNVGELLSKTYGIRRLLGAGGMGQVYEAEDLLLRRRVAIKAHWRDLQQFSIRKEAQALAAIRHPSIATVFGVGEHGGVEYVVMERIAGITLAQHLDERCRGGSRGPLPIDEAIEILSLLAEALAAVHAAGIAHRDVKPGNVMLAPGGRLVLMDFGIMLPEYAASPDAPMPGTAEYMAPEAIRCSVEPGRAFLLDVYAFGVLAHELICGERPFHAPTPQELLGLHLVSNAPTLTRLRPDVPPQLDTLIASCLSKKPDERPQSMELVLIALRQMRGRVSRTTSTPGTVLIVEDDPAFADVLSSVVQDTAPRAHVVVAHDAEAALECLRRGSPDLMLLDVGLPGMSGLELCMYLRGARLAESTTIVSLSAAAQPPDVALLRQLGVRHFLRKDDRLVERVEALVRSVRDDAQTAARCGR